MPTKDLDKQIRETEHKLKELKKKETKGPRVKRASIILSSDGTQIGSISFFDDLKTIFILGTERYISRRGEKAFWTASGYAANLGHKLKNIPVG